MTTPSTLAGFPFLELEFGPAGEALYPAQRDALVAGCSQLGVTDLIFLAHGFRCDANDATELYTSQLTTLRANLARPEFGAALSGRTFAVAGVYWPSQEYHESSGVTLSQLRPTLCGGAEALNHARSLLPALPNSRSAQDQFVSSVLSAFPNGQDDPTEGLPLLHKIGGFELLNRLQPRLEGAIGEFLNLMSWTAMKSLSGAVGATGLAPIVSACQRELPTLKIHLVGHSLGGRLMASCAKALSQLQARPIDSLSLLEAAFSHYGFSPDAGWGQRGFFREVVDAQIVNGPLISTFSRRDVVVGTAYSVASRLAHDNLQSIGDASDPYGGIGHNGAQRTPESTTTPLHPAGQCYDLQPGAITCLDGSAGLISGHGDVTNEHVTYAVASAISCCIRAEGRNLHNGAQRTPESATIPCDLQPGAIACPDGFAPPRHVASAIQNGRRPQAES